jgi:hypothetical protein
MARDSVSFAVQQWPDSMHIDRQLPRRRPDAMRSDRGNQPWLDRGQVVDRKIASRAN